MSLREDPVQSPLLISRNRPREKKRVPQSHTESQTHCQWLRHTPGCSPAPPRSPAPCTMLLQSLCALIFASFLTFRGDLHRGELWVLSENFRGDFLNLCARNFSPNLCHLGQNPSSLLARDVLGLGSRLHMSESDLPRCLPTCPRWRRLVTLCCLSLCRISLYPPSRHTQKP